MAPPADQGQDTRPPCFGLTCPLGCNESMDRCYQLQPSNFDPSGFFGMVSANVEVLGSSIIDTQTGEVKAATIIRPAGSPGAVVNGVYWGVIQQGPDYPEISVFGVASLKIQQGADLAVVGQRALALYATGDVDIAGSLSASPNGSAPGAGGFDGGSQKGASGAPCFGGEGRGGKDPAASSGGGGGGRKSSGGTGGTESGAVEGGDGGSPTGNETLVPFFGGCGGGAGGGDKGGGIGGGGGGAIQISANGTLSIDGLISVSGAGGHAGNYSDGGGGGGSGGAILLEAHSIKVSGTLAANGGGGGSGSSCASGVPGKQGQDGQPSTGSAAGGQSTGSDSGAGGEGGALGSEEGAPGGSNNNAGGGGGAAGRIRCNALNFVGSAKISPAPSTSNIAATW